MPSTFEKIRQALERPGAAARGGIGALQEDVTDPTAAYEAAKQAFQSPETAPTGYDIAERFGESANIENPYILGALATIAETADPTSLVPMVGPMAKLPKALKATNVLESGIKGMGRGERALSKVGDIQFPARSTAEAMKIEEALKQAGRVPEKSMLQVGERAPIEMREALTSPKLSKEELGEVVEQFPSLRRLRRYGGSN